MSDSRPGIAAEWAHVFEDAAARGDAIVDGFDQIYGSTH